MCEARYASRDGSYGLCSLLVYQLVGAGASLLLESAHFLHGSEQRVAAQFGVHLVKHFAHGVDDAEVWQTVFEERVDGLLVGRAALYRCGCPEYKQNQRLYANLFRCPA